MTAPKFSHAFDISFEILSNHGEAEDVTADMLRAALRRCAEELTDDDLLDLCHCVDTVKNEAAA